MWLVFDVGSGSTKAALIAEGEILRSASAAYPTDFRRRRRSRTKCE